MNDNVEHERVTPETVRVEGGAHRVALRIAAVLPWTIGLFALRMCVRPFRRIAPRFDQRVRMAIFRFWAGGARRIFGMRVQVHGTPPPKPFFMVSNHLTHVDTIVFAEQLACTFVAMMEMRGWALIGYLTDRMDHVFIKRQDKRDVIRVNRALPDLYARGEGIMVYPEATTSPGAAVLPFHAALFAPAAREGWPVHYATIRHETPQGYPPASGVVCWVGETPFAKQFLRMLRLPYINTTITFGDHPVESRDRKELATATQRGVLSQLDPMEQLPAS